MPELLVGGHRILEGEAGRARVGELVTITVDEQAAATGDHWELGPLVPGLELVSEETNRFHLKAKSRGAYSVSLHLCRPQEKAPADEWHCHLIV